MCSTTLENRLFWIGDVGHYVIGIVAYTVLLLLCIVFRETIIIIKWNCKRDFTVPTTACKDVYIEDISFPVIALRSVVNGAIPRWDF